MRAEENIEQKLCYANPFMLEVWKRLLTMGKKMIIVSDMYLPGKCIAKILENAGYTGIQKVYVSNTYRKSKADGSLYREIIKDWYHIDIESNRVRKGKNLLEKERGHARMRMAFQLFMSGITLLAMAKWQGITALISCPIPILIRMSCYIALWICPVSLAAHIEQL